MITDYIKAKKIGDRQVHREILAGRYPYLPSLDDILRGEGAVNEIGVGLTEIPISMIAGTRTNGRQNAFSCGFMPILDQKSEFALKWGTLYDYQMEEGIRDAVKVYEYMQKFYVEEGNKRVSVMKYLGMPLILADVIRVVPKRTDDLYNRIYFEFVDFYNVASIYDISFSELGCYKQLAEMLGQNLTDPWPDEVVQTVKSAYLYFSDIFEAKGGGRLNLTTGDAFLVYLTIYSIDSLLNESKSVLEKRIDRIWNEILVETRDDNIALVETPDTIERAGQPSAAASFLSVIKNPHPFTETHPLRVAFIYDRTPEESSWIYSHELGRNALETKFEGILETVKFEGCASDEAIVHAVEAAAADGDELVITTSPAQMPQTLRCAIEHPDMKFMNCSINLSHNAVRTYYGRMHEAKFLMGALAASVAENHKIAYRADYPIYGTVANINAFAIGAAMVDPKAELYLTWASKKDVDWRQEMYSRGVSVLSGPDLIRPLEASREYGIYQFDGNGTVLNLAAPMWDWGRYYELIVRTILNGTWNAREIARKDQALNYWFGMQSGVIDVIVSERISYYSRKLVNTLKHALIADTLNPFDGELRSQDGLIKTADEPRLTNEQIIKMDWLNDNVIGSLPDISELNDAAKETVQVSGVKDSAGKKG